jgi:hypothetical protein
MIAAASRARASSFKPMDEADGPHSPFPTAEILGGAAGGMEAFLRVESRFDGGHHMLGNVILEIKHITQRPVVALAPDLDACLGFDQLHMQPEPVRRSADAAGDQVLHAQLRRDLARVQLAAGVGERCGAGDDQQPAQARQTAGHLLRNSLGDMGKMQVNAEIGEWQHGDGRTTVMQMQGPGPFAGRVLVVFRHGERVRHSIVGAAHVCQKRHRFGLKADAEFLAEELFNQLGITKGR